LIVDDNATNRRILEEWLRGWQMKSVAVGDGLAALDALWHGAACGRPYALVLLDARMPDVDGLALAAQIRQRAELSATRTILLTSGDPPSDLARFHGVRVDAHLLKPVPQDELLETNGREALGRAEEGAFDLLLLDVHMPELDGFQVIRAVRERERTAGGHLPVIALTARSRKEDRDRCLAAGMDDFLAKPIQAADLWAAIARVVGASPSADRLGPGLLDPRVLLAACGGDSAILEKICQAFRAHLPD